MQHFIIVHESFEHAHLLATRVVLALSPHFLYFFSFTSHLFYCSGPINGRNRSQTSRQSCVSNCFCGRRWIVGKLVKFWVAAYTFSWGRPPFLYELVWFDLREDCFEGWIKTVPKMGWFLLVGSCFDYLHKILLPSLLHPALQDSSPFRWQDVFLLRVKLNGVSELVWGHLKHLNGFLQQTEALVTTGHIVVQTDYKVGHPRLLFYLGGQWRCFNHKTASPFFFEVVDIWMGDLFGVVG